MISLNAYSLAYSMGLLRKKNMRSWKLIDFIKFCKNKKIDFLEFPIDYFSNKEKTSLKKKMLETFYFQAEFHAYFAIDFLAKSWFFE